MSNYQVGQTLWFVPSGRWEKPGEITIEAVGRKWLTCGRYRLDKETLRADGGQYSSPGRAWLNKGAHDAEIALNEGWNDFAKKISIWNKPKGLTLEKLAQINALVFGEEQSK